MKRIITLFIFTLTAGVTLYSQTGYRVATAQGLPVPAYDSDDISTSQVSLHNAWFGSSFSYKMTGDANFNENFLFNANVLYNIEFGDTGWNFPVVGNISLPISGGSFNDIDIGIYPWKLLHSSKEVTVVAHGGASYSIDPKTTSEYSPQSFRILGGVEVSVPIRKSDLLPLTFSVTPTFEVFNLDRGSDFGLEGTVIFPIAGNLGLIGELQVPFGSNTTRSAGFSVGVLVNGAIGK